MIATSSQSSLLLLVMILLSGLLCATVSSLRFEHRLGRSTSLALVFSAHSPRCAAAAVMDGSRALLPSSSSSSSWSFALHSTNNDDDAVALLEIRQRLATITESLEQARKREVEARLDNNLLKGRRDGTKIMTENVVAQLKRGFADEIDILSDRIEGAQDQKREAMSRMRSAISTIREEAAVRADKLKSELSNLESRLVSLRKEATLASKGRNSARRLVEGDVLATSLDLRKEIDTMKAGLVKEKRRLKLERWDYESRIQRAKVDAVSAIKRLREVEEEERVTLPLISELRVALSDTIKSTSSQIEELQEGRKARKMFFDTSFRRIREEKREEMKTAKEISEVEMSDEDAKLIEATSYYELLLSEADDRLRHIAELSNEPVERSGYKAIADAQSRMETLIQEKSDAISRQEAERFNALKEVTESYTAVQDRYDATYENALRDLDSQRSRSVRKLEKEDRKSEKRMSQLREEIEKMTLQFSTLMKDERDAATLDYQELMKSKNAALEKSVSQYEQTVEEIRNVRSNLIFIQREMNQLEGVLGRNRLTLNELEEERASFRKQMGRTLSIAIGRITRR